MTRPIEESSGSRIKQIFVEICDANPEQRVALLESRCGADAALRAAVQSLLEAHERAGQFLAGPTVGQTNIPDSSADQLPGGKLIGPYKLLQIVGEGGFGTVYMAEQEHPVRRRVALKIIKLGMDTRQVVARFEAERQALAMMDHPNIAKVFDAGATDAGRPYFVMELVKGDPITKYCDSNRLSPRQRLELFIPVCQAVQHAHQKGIIHREIKPSNVLVTLHDGNPVPKVIDFGIAKATQARLTEKTLFTEFRQMIGTPEYMSPEQAEMSGLDIDTRSDIYSLGVLLYELLTGTTPFDARELRSKAFAEIQRVIREVEPPKMSTRLSTLKDSLPSIAAQRNIEPRKLNTIVRGELDWIVMKCMEKDRTRRYESASAVAADIAHHLLDEPVNAAAPSAAYRVHKFVRRHRVGVGMTIAVFLALLLGLAAALYAMRRAIRAEALAQQRLEDVTREAAKSDAVNSFLNSMLTAADPFRAAASELTVRQMLEQSAATIDAGAMSGEPAIEAAIRTTIGRSLNSLGRPAEAAEQHRRALEMLRRQQPSGDSPQIADVLNLLGMSLADLHRLDDAEQITRQALEMRTRIGGANSRQALESLTNLASISLERGDFRDAELLYRRAVEMHEQAGTPPADRATHLNGLAVTLSRSGQYAEAEKVLREVIELNGQVLTRDDPSNALPLCNLATALIAQRRLPEAEAALREAQRITQKTLPANHPDQAFVLHGLASVLLQQDRLTDAEAAFRQCIEIEKASRGQSHPEYAIALGNLADVLIKQQRFAEAEALLLQSVQVHVEASGEDHSASGNARSLLGNVQVQLGKLEEAEKNLRQGYATLRPDRDAPQLMLGLAAARYANLLQQLNRIDEADAVFREAIAILREQPRAASRFVITLLNYADIALKRGSLDEAESISREALELSLKLEGPDSPQTAIAQSRLAFVLARSNRKLDEAEQLARQALSMREKTLSGDSWLVLHNRSLIGEILLRQGKTDEGAAMLRHSCAMILRDASATEPARSDARERLAILAGNIATVPTTLPSTTPTEPARP